MNRPKDISRRGAGRVAYLAVRTQVEELLAAGHHVAAIYARLSAGLPIGYKQFAKYVQRFSDDRKVRPYGWTPPIKGAAPPKSPVPAPTSSPPTTPVRPWRSDLFPSREDEESLF